MSPLPHSTLIYAGKYVMIGLRCRDLPKIWKQPRTLLVFSKYHAEHCGALTHVVGSGHRVVWMFEEVTAYRHYSLCKRADNRQSHDATSFGGERGAVMLEWLSDAAVAIREPVEEIVA